MLLTCFYIDRQLFTNAFKNFANLHFNMVPDFTMNYTVVIVYFILAAINDTYYNPLIVFVVQYLHKFSLLFLENHFLFKYGILKPILGMKLIFLIFLTFVNS